MTISYIPGYIKVNKIYLMFGIVPVSTWKQKQQTLCRYGTCVSPTPTAHADKGFWCYEKFDLVASLKDSCERSARLCVIGWNLKNHDKKWLKAPNRVANWGQRSALRYPIRTTSPVAKGQLRQSTIALWSKNPHRWLKAPDHWLHAYTPTVQGWWVMFDNKHPKGMCVYIYKYIYRMINIYIYSWIYMCVIVYIYIYINSSYIYIYMIHVYMYIYVCKFSYTLLYIIYCYNNYILLFIRRNIGCMSLSIPMLLRWRS